MSTIRLSYESVDTEDLTRLLQRLKALQGSAQQFLDCNRFPWSKPTSGFATAASQKLVASSQFVADFNAVKASMEWLTRDKSATSGTTPSAGDSSTPIGESPQTRSIGIPTHQPGNLQGVCNACKGKGVVEWHGHTMDCKSCRGTGIA